MRQVKAFEAFAKDVPKSAAQEISLVYDPFTPPRAAGRLIDAQRNTPEF